MANVINKIYYFTPTVGIMGRKGTGAANKGALKPVFILLPLIGAMSCPDNRPGEQTCHTADSHSTERKGNVNCHATPNVFSLLYMHKGALSENVI